jgi:hypothetical protein
MFLWVTQSLDMCGLPINANMIFKQIDFMLIIWRDKVQKYFLTLAMFIFSLYSVFSLNVHPWFNFFSVLLSGICLFLAGMAFQSEFVKNNFK